MATLKKYNLDGKEIGSLKVADHLANAEANSQMVKDYITALRANTRRWTASTKTRAEVNHSTKKPHAQKGTGRARQGRLSSPQFRGGGRVFGPRPKFDQHVRINKKERQAAIRSLIAEKIRNNKVHVLDSTSLKTPKTKTVANFLKTFEIRGRVLFLGEGSYAKDENDPEKKVSVESTKHQNFIKSLRNIPRMEFSLATNVSGYDILLAQNLFVTEEALNELQQWLG